MAGRGTDIVLGGNLEAELNAAANAAAGATAAAGGSGRGISAGGSLDQATHDAIRRDWQVRHDKVVAAGGLHIVGTERHESRRIDNQLRGRSGRQGDPGSSRFYLSMEDNLMRIFGDPNRTKALLSRVGMKEGEVIESRMLTRQIERAQRKVEAHNFDARKNLLEYDDVANDQRKVIYSQRTDLMAAEDIADAVRAIREETVNRLIDSFIPPKSIAEQWDVAGLTPAIERDFGLKLDVQSWLDQDAALEEAGLRKRIVDEVAAAYEQKVAQYGAPVMRHIEKAIMLQQLDSHWREHLAAMDYMRQGIHLRGYAQKNPKQEYKREAFELFSSMLDRIKFDTVTMLSKVQVRNQEEIDREEEERQRRLARALQMQHEQAQSAMGGDESAPGPDTRGGGQAEQHTPFVRSDRKVGRNEPCPCGSGKKYKHCHGALA